MARIARVIAAGIPHHVVQRGNRRQPTFFRKDDYIAYKRFMNEFCRRFDVEVWAYCLMPNHVHLILVPHTDDGLRKAVGESHRRYTSSINKREGWVGHLWQGRFSSCPMDERYLISAARYVEQNPVRAKLVSHPSEWAWSSARAHLQGRDDDLVAAGPLLEIIPDWEVFLDESNDEFENIRKHEHTGRPLGDDAFIEKCEKKTNRMLRRMKRGPKQFRAISGSNFGDTILNCNANRNMVRK